MERKTVFQPCEDWMLIEICFTEAAFDFLVLPAVQVPQQLIMPECAGQAIQPWNDPV